MVLRSGDKMTVANRNGINLRILLVTVLFLSVALVVGEVSFTTRISGISQNLGKALNKVLDVQDTNYTSIHTNATYESDVKYNAKGMAGLYNITHWFMDFIQHKELFPKDVHITDDKGDIQISKVIEQWPALLKHYAGLLSITILGLLFAALMPLVGFVFCCCRCCGNCGARSQPFDKKHDMCKKVFLSMFLIGIATLILFGVVCAFVSNEHMQEGTNELPDSLRHSLADVKTYLKSTDAQIGTLLLINFEELKQTLFSILDSSSDIICEQLIEYSKAVSFTHLVSFIEGLTDIRAELQVMQNSTKELRVKASQLNDGLRRVKNELLHTLKQCSFGNSNCSKVYGEVSQLGTSMDFDNLPDVSQAVSDLSQFISGDNNLVDEIEEGKKNFSKIPESIALAVNKSIPAIKNAINTAGKSLDDGSRNVSDMLRKIMKLIDDDGENAVEESELFLKKYAIYRYYVGLFMSIILLIVIMCITFGLMCGICGKRPDGYDDDCCNKGAGSKFLMLGVAVMFLFSIVLMVLTLLYFLSGVLVQRLACDTLRNTSDPQVFNIIEKSIKFQSYVDSPLVDVIQSCHRNESAYKVLHLKNKLDVNDISGYLDKYDINKKIDDIESQIGIDKNFVLLNKTSKQRVIDLRDSEIANINFHRFANILSNNLTSIDLNQLADDLKHARENIESDRSMQELTMSMKQNELYLRMYQTNLVVPMIEYAEDLKMKAEHLDQLLKFNQTDFKSAIDHTLDEVEQAQDFISHNGTEEMRKLAKEFATGFKDRVTLYLNRVGITVNDTVGQCGPLSNVYNATLIATCDKLLNPWNGFWLSVGYCLILFIPTIVLSVKLATLYQKSDPYPGPLVESEYLYDAYADRDNIPLSNVSSKQNKKKKKKHRGGDVGMYESRGGGAGGDVGARERDAPGGSSHPDTRYADMAPKHWEDYSNGGPPQYQSAPLATEYERPPPYYYPGPGNRP